MGHTGVKQNILLISPVCFSIFSVLLEYSKSHAWFTQFCRTRWCWENQPTRGRGQGACCSRLGARQPEMGRDAQTARAPHTAPGKFTLLSPNPKFRWRWVTSPELSKTHRDMDAEPGSLQTGPLRINNDINLEAV